MKKRDFEKEYMLLSSYLQSLNDSKIELVVFNSSLKEVLYFDHRKGISNTSFKEALEQVFYDGMANYDHIAHTTDFDPDLVFLFSDATSFIGALTTMYDAPVFTINSLSQSNEEKLQRLALYTDGHYINLTKTSTEKALSFLQYDLEDFEVYEQKRDKNHWIEGSVSLDSIPLQSVSVRIIGTYVEEVTDADGNFSIEASEGDDLLFSYVGAKTETVKVIEPSLPLIVKMKPEGDLLNEVKISGKAKRKSIPFTKRKRVTYSIDEITSADIDAHYERLQDVLLDKTFVRRQSFNNKIIRGTFFILPRGYGGGIGGRGFPTIPALLIDGVFFRQINAPYVDPQEISSVSIVSPLAAKNRFGPDAGGGLIVIRTKRFQQGIDGVLEEKEEELLNKYTDHLDFYETSFSNAFLIESLIKETNPQSAYQNYKKNSSNSVDINYFIEAAEIMSKWDQDIAFDIISNVLTLAPENPKLLRIVAGYFEQFKKYKEAAYLYEEIAKIRPLEAQSHRDLAMIYEVNGDYNEAFDLYKRMLVNKINNIDFIRLKPLLTNELNRMVSLYGEDLFSDEVLHNFSKINSAMDGRLVLNWSESKAAFKIRFVSPDKRFFDWSSSKSQKFKNTTREGFSIEEFVLDDAFKGEWLINLEYSDRTHGNLIPLFIKYTFYKDYGLPNETKEVKMVRLLKENKKVTLSKIIL
jgi:tetratricopeptide (TPR) repeat protein